MLTPINETNSLEIMELAVAPSGYAVLVITSQSLAYKKIGFAATVLTVISAVLLPFSAMYNALNLNSPIRFVITGVNLACCFVFKGFMDYTYKQANS